MPKSKGIVLITGSSGFIGGALFEKFKTLGYETYGIGRRHLDIPNYIQYDLVQPLQLDVKPEIVIHAAALASPWGTRQTFVDNNVIATQNVIEFCKQNSLPKLIYISSSSVFYKNEHQFNIHEETPLPEKAINLYAETKLAAEKDVMNYAGEWAILRPRAVFGPGDTVLFPRILIAAKQGKLPLIINKDGPAMGDLIYIDNLVDYIVQAATAPEISGCYNLTNNQPVAMIDFLMDIFSKLNLPQPKKKVSVTKAMLAAAVVEKLYSAFLPDKEPPVTRFGVSVFAYSKTFDVSKMIADMGLPKVSLAEGSQRFVEWIKKENPYG